MQDSGSTSTPWPSHSSRVWIGSSLRSPSPVRQDSKVVAIRPSGSVGSSAWASPSRSWAASVERATCGPRRNPPWESMAAAGPPDGLSGASRATRRSSPSTSGTPTPAPSTGRRASASVRVPGAGLPATRTTSSVRASNARPSGVTHASRIPIASSPASSAVRISAATPSWKSTRRQSGAPGRFSRDARRRGPGPEARRARPPGAGAGRPAGRPRSSACRARPAAPPARRPGRPRVQRRPRPGGRLPRRRRERFRRGGSATDPVPPLTGLGTRRRR